MKRIILAIVAVLSSVTLLASEKKNYYSIVSPDGTLEAVVTTSPEDISFNLSQDGVLLMKDSKIGLSFADSKLNTNTVSPRIRRSSIDRTIPASTYKKSSVHDLCNTMVLGFKYFSIEFRAYNDGFAYRFVTKVGKPFQIENEKEQFRFADNYNSYIPYVNSNLSSIETQLFNSFEQTYTYAPVSEMEKGHLAFLPVTVCGPGERKICITETDLYNYPGMYMVSPADGSLGMNGYWAEYPIECHTGGHNNLQRLVDKRAPYIATYEKDVNLPWRILNVSRDDIDLENNDLSFLLASPQREDIDFSFVKPGKVAWDWWNDWNIYGVDFVAGINNQTYKYYIDFASKFSIEYVILDEGWTIAGTGSLKDLNPDVDVAELVAYGAQKGVGIVLWAGCGAFNEDMEAICKKYSEMGVKGFKVDFMDGDDQLMTNFHYKAAEMTARYGLMIDFHGTYKPVGLHRTFPNVVNYEGVHGLEQMKWTSPDDDQVTYDVTLPFTRAVAGPMDYTQGAMRNAARGHYQPDNSEPASQGTRCHQLGMYAVFESPFSMLCDSPSNYYNETECTSFIASVPTTWDQTVALEGKIAQYATIARRKGSSWWIGSINGWDPRVSNIDLSFLGEGQWEITLFQDGVNAHRAARDYKKSNFILEGRSLEIPCAPGGGYLMKVERVEE